MEPFPVFISNMSTKHYIATGIYCAIGLPSLVVNIFLLFIVCRSTAFRDVSTMLVSFISFADVLYIIYTSAYVTVQYMNLTLPGVASTVCITVQSVIRVVPACTFLLISYNWYLAAFEPSSCYKFHQLPNVALKCFVGTWLVSLASNIGVPFVIVDRFNKLAFAVYSILVVVLFYLVPLIVEIILHIKSLNRTKMELQYCTNHKTVLTYNQKIAKIFVILSVSFFICTAPIVMYPVADMLGFKSSSFAVFAYHLISCFPCLMNPVCHWVISKKFQNELKGLCCMKKSKDLRSARKNKEKFPITPETFSANRGFFDPCTPSWRQGTEYFNRELIYGEQPSVVPQEQAKNRKVSIKNVRFSGEVEDIAIAAEDLEPCQSRSSKGHIDSVPEEENTTEFVMSTNKVASASMVFPDTQVDVYGKSTTQKPVSKSSSHLGTWPPRCDNALEKHNVANVKKQILLRRGDLQEFHQTMRHNAVERSKSLYIPSSGNSDRARFVGMIGVTTVPETMKRELQLDVDGYEEKTIFQTHL